MVAPAILGIDGGEEEGKGQEGEEVFHGHRVTKSQGHKDRTTNNEQVWPVKLLVISFVSYI